MLVGTGSSADVALGIGEDLVCILILILRRAPADEETDTVDAVDDEAAEQQVMAVDVEPVDVDAAHRHPAHALASLRRDARRADAR